MQYLLTEEERTALVPRENYEAQQRALAWCFKRLQPARCPHLESVGYAYCDDCLLAGQSVKKRSDSPPDDLARLICTLPRSYSK